MDNVSETIVQRATKSILISAAFGAVAGAALTFTPFITALSPLYGAAAGASGAVLGNILSTAVSSHFSRASNAYEPAAEITVMPEPKTANDEPHTKQETPKVVRLDSARSNNSSSRNYAQIDTALDTLEAA